MQDWSLLIHSLTIYNQPPVHLFLNDSWGINSYRLDYLDPVALFALQLQEELL